MEKVVISQKDIKNVTFDNVVVERKFKVKFDNDSSDSVEAVAKVVFNGDLLWRILDNAAKPIVIKWQNNARKYAVDSDDLISMVESQNRVINIDFDEATSGTRRAHAVRLSADELKVQIEKMTPEQKALLLAELAK